MFKKMVIVILVCFVSQSVFAETLTVKMKCTNGKCVPEQQLNQVDMGKINDLKNKLNAAKNKLDKVEQAVELGEDIADLKRQMKDVYSNLSEMEKTINNIGSDVKDLQKDVLELKQSFIKQHNCVVLVYIALSDRIRFLENDVKMKFRNRKINLEIGPYGIYSRPFGFSVGLSTSLDIPMGDLGNWHTFLTGGLGLSPSISLGYVTSLSIDRKLNKYMLLGPSILTFGDFRNMIDQKINWVAAIGIDTRFTFGGVNLVVVPFVGFGPQDQNISVTKENIVYRETPCGLVSEKVSEDVSSVFERKLQFQGGFVVSLTYSLF